MEAAHRTRLAKGEVDLGEREAVPTLSGFKARFIDETKVRRKDHPETIDFYTSKYAGLLRYAPLAQARLNRIDEKLIAEFTARMVKDNYERSTINRHLATLRRALRLAAKWRVIDRVPTIELLSGENEREFVLSRELQVSYLDACPEFLRNWALFALETGMRRKELRGVKWSDVHFEPVGKARCGFVHVRGTKSKNSKRNLSLTVAAQMILLQQREISECDYVFVMDTDHKRQASVLALNHAHERVRSLLGMPKEFVLTSLRHTFGTRLGETGVDAFAIMRIMGHGSISISQRYVHPTPETIENAFLALDRANHTFELKMNQEIEQRDKWEGAATVSVTVDESAEKPVALVVQ